MRRSTESLVRMFEANGVAPTCTRHQSDGRTRLEWRKWSPLERYVEMLDAVDDESVALLSRAGQSATAVVLSNAGAILSWVGRELSERPVAAGSVDPTRDLDRRVGLAVSQAAGVPSAYLLHACFEPLGRAAREMLQQLGWTGPGSS